AGARIVHVSESVFHGDVRTGDGILLFSWPPRDFVFDCGLVDLLECVGCGRDPTVCSIGIEATSSRVSRSLQQCCNFRTHCRRGEQGPSHNSHASGSKGRRCRARWRGCRCSTDYQMDRQIDGKSKVILLSWNLPNFFVACVYPILLQSEGCSSAMPVAG